MLLIALGMFFAAFLGEEVVADGEGKLSPNMTEAVVCWNVYKIIMSSDGSRLLIQQRPISKIFLKDISNASAYITSIDNANTFDYIATVNDTKIEIYTSPEGNSKDDYGQISEIVQFEKAKYLLLINLIEDENQRSLLQLLDTKDPGYLWTFCDIKLDRNVIEGFKDRIEQVLYQSLDNFAISKCIHLNLLE